MPTYKDVRVDFAEKNTTEKNNCWYQSTIDNSFRGDIFRRRGKWAEFEGVCDRETCSGLNQKIRREPISIWLLSRKFNLKSAVYVTSNWSACKVLHAKPTANCAMCTVCRENGKLGYHKLSKSVWNDNGLKAILRSSLWVPATLVVPPFNEYCDLLL